MELPSSNVFTFIVCNPSHSTSRQRNPSQLQNSLIFLLLQMTTCSQYFIFAVSTRSWKDEINLTFLSAGLHDICFSRSSLPQILPLPIHVCILNIDLIFLYAKDRTLSFSLTGRQAGREGGGCLGSLCCHKEQFMARQVTQNLHRQPHTSDPKRGKKEELRCPEPVLVPDTVRHFTDLM